MVTGAVKDVDKVTQLAASLPEVDKYHSDRKDHAILSFDANGSTSSSNCLHGIFHLKQVTIGGKDGYGTIV